MTVKEREAFMHEYIKLEKEVGVRMGLSKSMLPDATSILYVMYSFKQIFQKKEGN